MRFSHFVITLTKQPAPASKPLSNPAARCATKTASTPATNTAWRCCSPAYGISGIKKQKSKFEYRNPKQIRNTKDKTRGGPYSLESFLISHFEFVSDFGF